MTHCGECELPPAKAGGFWSKRSFARNEPRGRLAARLGVDTPSRRAETGACGLLITQGPSLGAKGGFARRGHISCRVLSRFRVVDQSRPLPRRVRRLHVRHYATGFGDF